MVFALILCLPYSNSLLFTMNYSTVNAKTLQTSINLHPEYAKPLQILANTIKYYQIPFKYCKYQKFKVGGLNIVSIVFEAACNSTNVEHGDRDCWHNTGYYSPMGLPRTRCIAALSPLSNWISPKARQYTEA